MDETEMNGDEEFLTCDICGDEGVSKDDAIITEDDYTCCNDCYIVCEHCENTFSTNANTSIVDGNERWCEDCLDYAYYCERCEEYNSDGSCIVRDIGEHWCEHCIFDAAYYCEYCEEYNMEPCECTSRVIHDYNYKPDVIFHSTSAEDNAKLFFGIEVEMESPNGSFSTKDEAAEYAHQLENLDLAYLKNDGSLEVGFELVTHPMTYNYYKNEAPKLWEVIQTLKDSYEMRSWGTRTCGLHIHISRRGFTSGSHMHRFLRLIYSNQRFFERLAGRSSNRWSSFEDVIDENGKRHYKNKIERGSYTDRYTAVNTTNRNTLEVRIFRGTLKVATLLSQIALMHACVEYTRVMSVKQVSEGALEWTELVRYVQENQELYPDLVERLDRLNIVESMAV